MNKNIYTMSIPSGISKAIQSAIAQQVSFGAAEAAAIQKQTGLAQAVQSAIAQQASFGVAVASAIQKQTGLAQAVQSAIAQQASFGAAVATAIKKQTGLGQAVQSALAQQTSFGAVAAALLKRPTLEQAFEVITKSEKYLLKDPNFLSEMAESINHLDINYDITLAEQTEFEENFPTLTKELSNASDSHAFIKNFRKLPPLLQAFIFFVFFQIFVPQVNNISSNLLMPVVKSFLYENELTHREKINNIKKLPQKNVHLSTHNLRFITGKSVHLRQNNSTQSAVLDELSFGQVVTVLSKKRNWIEVMYEYEDGEVMHGWVFTRYTKKFKH